MKENRPNPYPLRLDPELAKWVKEQAHESYRSFNAEINRLIREAKDGKNGKKPRTA